MVNVLYSKETQQYPFLPLAPILLPAAFLLPFTDKLLRTKVCIGHVCIFILLGWLHGRTKNEQDLGDVRLSSDSTALRIAFTCLLLNLGLSKLLDFSKSLFSHLRSGHIHPTCKNTWPHCNASWPSYLFLELAASLKHCILPPLTGNETKHLFPKPIMPSPGSVTISQNGSRIRKFNFKSLEPSHEVPKQTNTTFTFLIVKHTGNNFQHGRRNHLAEGRVVLASLTLVFDHRSQLALAVVHEGALFCFFGFLFLACCIETLDP